MCQLFLFQSSFLKKLQQYDESTLLTAKAKGCPHCAGILDRADFPRKPRCPFDALPDDFAIRYSLCCRTEGCRKRLTPKSVRFFGRRVYWSLAILLMSAQLLFYGTTTARTIRRWKAFWDNDFTASPAWQKSRGGFLVMDQGPDFVTMFLRSHSPLTPESVLRLFDLISPCWAK